jgi:hypothetical protein
VLRILLTEEGADISSQVNLLVEWIEQFAQFKNVLKWAS